MKYNLLYRHKALLLSRCAFTNYVWVATIHNFQLSHSRCLNSIQCFRSIIIHTITTSSVHCVCVVCALCCVVLKDTRAVKSEDQNWFDMETFFECIWIFLLVCGGLWKWYCVYLCAYFGLSSFQNFFSTEPSFNIMELYGDLI